MQICVKSSYSKTFSRKIVCTNMFGLIGFGFGITTILRILNRINELKVLTVLKSKKLILPINCKICDIFYQICMVLQLTCT